MSNQAIATLVPEDRATQLLSFDETKAQLTELSRQSERITQITNKAGRDECHSLLMVLKGRRVDIEKRGKEARDDANKFAKAVIAKEKELIGFIEPEEIRLQLLRDEWDTSREYERLAKIEAERLRVEAIQAKIQSIRDVPASLVGKPSIIIAGQLAKLRETELDEAELGEYYVMATDALTAATVRVEQLLAGQLDADAENRRQAARDEEMEVMRVKMAEQQRLIDEAEEAKRVEQERLAQVERDRAAREEADAQRRIQAIRDRISSITEKAVAISGRPSIWLQDTLGGLDSMRPSHDADSFDQFLGEASLAWDEAHDKIEEEIEIALLREKAEAHAKAEREAEDQRLQAEREHLDAQQTLLAKEAAAMAKERAAAAKKAEADRLANLGLRDAAHAVVEYFAQQLADGSAPTSVKDLRSALANDENRDAVARTVNRSKKVAK